MPDYSSNSGQLAIVSILKSPPRSIFEIVRLVSIINSLSDSFSLNNLTHKADGRLYKPLTEHIFWLNFWIYNVPESKLKIYVSLQSEYAINYPSLSKQVMLKSPFFSIRSNYENVSADHTSIDLFDPFNTHIEDVSLSIFAICLKGNGGIWRSFGASCYCLDYFPNWSLNLPLIKL